MALANALINVLLVAASTVVITWVLSGRFRGIEKRIDRLDDSLHTEVGALRSEFNGLRAELKGLRADVLAEFGSVRAEFGAEFGSVRAEFGSVRAELSATRSDLTAVALAVGVRPRTGQTGTGTRR
jgi:hypothetical protein